MMRYFITMLVFVFSMNGCSYKGLDSFEKGDLKIINICTKRLEFERASVWDVSMNQIHKDFHRVRIVRDSFSNYVYVSFGSAEKKIDPKIIFDRPAIICWVDEHMAVKSLSAPKDLDSIESVHYVQFSGEEQRQRKQLLESSNISGEQHTSLESVYKYKNGNWLRQLEQ
ncbi:hypothetical protein KFE80_03280 [bacterium SCSIO 12696]|nr:hypothetical protein KFE80_03280 [bacterium SCSIO 12696]